LVNGGARFKAFIPFFFDVFFCQQNQREKHQANKKIVFHCKQSRKTTIITLMLKKNADDLPLLNKIKKKQKIALEKSSKMVCYRLL